MIVVMLIIRKDYEIPLYKGLIGSILLTFIGVLSVKLMYFIENGDFSGLSFFGAVLFIPILAIPISVVLNIKYQDYIDICAPSVAIMLSAMKINCLRSGCCIGKVLYTNEFGATIRFPSQIFEMIVAFLICVLLIYASKKKIYKTKLYPAFMILYGATRFVLNIFRETDDFWFGLGIGNMWAIVSVILGFVWIFVLYKINNKTKEIISE